MQAHVDAVVDIDRLEELASALCRMADSLDGFLLSDRMPDREDVRLLRLLTTHTLRAVGATVDDLHVRQWDESVEAGLCAIADEYAAITGTIPQVSVRGSADRLPKPVVDVLRQVAGDALHTIARHARASVLLLSLNVDDGSVRLDVVDDGVDLNCRPAAAWASSVEVALRRMGSAVHAIGGRLVVQPLTPRGVRLQAVLPPMPSGGG